MRRMQWIAAVVAASVGFVVGVTACAQPGDRGVDEAPAGPVPWDTTLDLGAPGGHLATATAVSFYPACGNEVLQFDGRSWYPFAPANPSDFPADPLQADDADARAMDLAGEPATNAGMVIAPGPGDAVGTLVVFEGGFAYWQSDSGDLDTWLVTTEITYQWVC